MAKTDKSIQIRIGLQRHNPHPDLWVESLKENWARLIKCPFLLS